MSENVGAVRTPAGLARAEGELAKMIEWADKSAFSSPEGFELYGMIQTASEIVRAACVRHENIGAHYMEEYE